jgi:hypothetical protein
VFTSFPFSGTRCRDYLLRSFDAQRARMLLVLLNEFHYHAALTFDFGYSVEAVVVDFHSRSVTADKTPVIELFDSVC